jgi:hypothetical protein
VTHLLAQSRFQIAMDATIVFAGQTLACRAGGWYSPPSIGPRRRGGKYRHGHTPNRRSFFDAANFDLPICGPERAPGKPSEPRWAQGSCVRRGSHGSPWLRAGSYGRRGVMGATHRPMSGKGHSVRCGVARVDHEENGLADSGTRNRSATCSRGLRSSFGHGAPSRAQHCPKRRARQSGPSEGAHGADTPLQAVH